MVIARYCNSDDNCVMLLGRSLNHVILALALAGWPRYQRTVRSKTFMLKNQPFVETGKSFGEKPWSILFLYILPSVLPSVLVMASISMPGFITSSATLSFLGMGAQPPSPDSGTGDRKKCQRNFQSTMAGYFPMSGIDLYNYYIQPSWRRD